MRRFGVSLLAAAGFHLCVLFIVRFPGSAAEPPRLLELRLDVETTAADAGGGASSAALAWPPAPASRPASAPQPAEAVAAPAPQPASAAPEPSQAAREAPAAPPQPEPTAIAASPAANAAAPGETSGGGAGAGGVPGGRPVVSGAPSGATGGEGTGSGAPSVSAPTAPRPRGAIQPAYPWSARRAGYQGVVTLAVLIDEMGKVVSVEVVTSSGHRVLDEAALDAIRAARFEPATRAGRPVSSRATIPVRFVLN